MRHGGEMYTMGNIVDNNLIYLNGDEGFQLYNK